MFYHKLELRNGRQRTSRAPSNLIFCAVSFDGVIISEERYKFDRCFSLSCKICCYPLFQIRVKLYLAILMYRLIDTILKVKFAPSQLRHFVRARTAMFLHFDLAQIFQDHEDRCRELSRELHKLCNLSRNA